MGAVEVHDDQPEAVGRLGELSPPVIRAEEPFALPMYMYSDFTGLFTWKTLLSKILYCRTENPERKLSQRSKIILFHIMTCIRLLSVHGSH